MKNHSSDNLFKYLNIKYIFSGTQSIFSICRSSFTLFWT